MRKLIVGLAVVACAAALAACGSTGTTFLNNVSTDCERHYNGSVTAGMIGGGNFTGTVRVDCVRAGEAAAPATGKPAATDAAAQPPS